MTALRLIAVVPVLLTIAVVMAIVAAVIVVVGVVFELGGLAFEWEALSRSDPGVPGVGGVPPARGERGPVPPGRTLR